MDEKTFKPSEMAFAILAIPGGVDGTLIIRVIAPTGSLVRAEKDGKFYSALEESGVWDIAIPEYGMYTITATLGVSFATVDVDVSPTTVEILKYSDVFGVCWDYSNPSTALERLQPDTDPYKYVNVRIDEEPIPINGSVGGSSPFDNYMPWKGMEQYNILPDNTIIKRGDDGFSQTQNDTMVLIPEFYYNVIDVPEESKRYWYISDKPRDDFEKHPGSGKYIARYELGKNYVSKSNLEPLTSVSYEQAIANISNKGDNYKMLDYATWCAVQLLYLIEFANWNSQSMMGYGVTNYSSSGRYRLVNSGNTDSLTYHTGSTNKTSAQTAVQYRWIENPYGNSITYITGSKMDKYGNLYISIDNDIQYLSSDIRLKKYDTFYISKLVYSRDFPWIFMFLETQGSQNTYICDLGLIELDDFEICKLHVGGGPNITFGAGMFCNDWFESSSHINSYIVSTRFMYITKKDELE